MKILVSIWNGCLVVVALPIAVIAGIVFPRRVCSPSQLAFEIRALAAGDMSYLDKLEHAPLKDKRLESIRQKVASASTPEALESLAREADAISGLSII